MKKKTNLEKLADSKSPGDLLLVQQLKAAGGKTFTVGPCMDLLKPETIEGYVWARNALTAAYAQGRRVGRAETPVQEAPQVTPAALSLIKAKAESFDVLKATFLNSEGHRVPRFPIVMFPKCADRAAPTYQMFDSQRQEFIGFRYAIYTTALEQGVNLARQRLYDEEMLAKAEEKIKAVTEAKDSGCVVGAPPAVKELSLEERINQAIANAKPGEIPSVDVSMDEFQQLLLEGLSIDGQTVH